MSIKEFDIQANRLGDFIHVRIRTVHGQIVDFAVMYDVLVDGEYRSAVRHDASHGYVHRDLLDWNGEKVRTDEIFRGMTLSHALNAAIEDFKTHHESYRFRFLRSRR